VLISIGALLGLYAMTFLPWGTVRPTWAPMFLVITLLVTDPSTIPKSPLGKVFYGLSFGLGTALLGAWMTEAQGNDFFSKILMVLPVNAARRQFDQAGRFIEERFAGFCRAFTARYNVGHMLVWWGLVLSILASGGKAEVFESTRGVVRPYVVTNQDGTVSCDKNPLYCRPFSFDIEMGTWAEQGFPRIENKGR
jgi:hypothetical protein